MDTSPTRRALTVEEVAALLGIGRSSTYRLVRTGAIRYLRIGKLIRIPTDAVDEYLIRSDRGKDTSF